MEQDELFERARRAEAIDALAQPRRDDRQQQIVEQNILVFCRGAETDLHSPSP